VTAEPLPVVVVGGGISGLSAAYYLARGGAEVRLFEASDRLGGNLRTEEHDGFLYDVGPDAFLRTKPSVLDLCAELGIGSELVLPLPTATKVYVAHEGRLEAMPEGLSFGVPKHPLALLQTSLLSTSGKLRALLEPLVPKAPPDEDETLERFLTRRLGAEMSERLVAPLLAGVFAGDAAELSMQAAFPQLTGYEERFGSLTAGTLGAAGSGLGQLVGLLGRLRSLPEGTRSPFSSLARGLGSLATHVAERLPPGTVRMQTTVRGLTETTEGIWVELDRGERVLARHVVMTGPPWLAARVLGSFDDALALPLSQVRGTPTATVFFGLRAADVERPLDASGFIAPPGEARILASSWVSSKWPGRAPPGHALVRAFVGGPHGGQLFASGDEELTRVAWAELTRLMGPLGQPLFSRVYCYERGSPQPEIGHLARLRQISARLERFPRLSLIGPGYDGVGIPDCVRQARAVAEALLKGAPYSGVVQWQDKGL
jgi:protoporphyrinogen/coproporphyrinogen III oxidase